MYISISIYPCVRVHVLLGGDMLHESCVDVSLNDENICICAVCVI